jgi:hypothetical protein
MMDHVERFLWGLWLEVEHWKGNEEGSGGGCQSS